MSLADELLADLEEGGEEEADPELADNVADAIEDVNDVAMETETKVTGDSVRQVAKLLDSNQVI
jgi:predicted solute-binding protein